MSRMLRENVEAKGRRYLVEGRCLVEQVTGSDVVATVRGDGAVHTVRHQRGGWSCDCPAHGRCAHLIAVGLITAPGVRLAVSS